MVSCGQWHAWVGADYPATHTGCLCYTEAEVVAVLMQQVRDFGSTCLTSLDHRQLKFTLVHRLAMCLGFCHRRSLCWNVTKP